MQTPGKLTIFVKGKPEQEYALPEGIVTIGRAEVSDIVLGDTTVSRAHARIECGSGGCILTDLGSVNGTRVNDHRVSTAKLSSGDTIAIGDSLLRFDSGVLRSELPATQIATLDELEDTLAGNPLPTTLRSTREPRLVIHTPGRTWDVSLVEEALSIGRDPDSSIPLDDGEASRHHGRIERRGNHFVFSDLRSTNGTWMGKERVHERVLEDGDVLRIGHARMVFKKGFAPEELTVVEPPLSERRRRRCPVVFIPGIMGSELWRGSERLWPDLKRMFSKPEALSLPDEVPLDPKALVNEVIIVPNMIKLARYKRLGNYLEEELGYERGKDFLEFPYDWRQDNRVSARRLGASIEEWQSKYKEAAGPVAIIAHSMGSLVARYYVERLNGKSKVGRLIFLGGPHYGSPKMITTLLHGPNLLPFGLLGERLRQMGTTLPSMYQLLPSYLCTSDQSGKPINVLTEECWVSDAQRKMLRDARAFRQEMGSRSSVPSISVFGYGLKTISKASVQTGTNGSWEKTEFTQENNGDGTVPEASAVLEGSEIHPVVQYHGSLYTDNDVLMRLKVELTRSVAVRD